MSSKNKVIKKQSISTGGKKSYLDAPIKEMEYGSRVFGIHLVTSKDLLLCPIDDCACRFESEMSLKVHMAQAHRVRSRRFSMCKNCNEEFYHSKKGQQCCSVECAVEYDDNEYANANNGDDE